MRLLDLAEAEAANGGGKVAGLAVLARAGMTVPHGFVIPMEALTEHLRRLDLDPTGPIDPQQILASRLDSRLIGQVAASLHHLGGGTDPPPVAVRSSATTEDRPHASGAGQHDSVLAVRGTEAVCRSVLRCWASLWSTRARTYRAGRTAALHDPAGMAVLVQTFIDADVSGVLFTGDTGVLEATPGLGDLLVSGRVTPDSWTIGPDGIRARRLGVRTHQSYRDQDRDRIVTRPLSPTEQETLCLTDRQVLSLHRLGARVTTLLGAPSDLEWAISGERIHILQARAITRPLPPPRPVPSRGAHQLHGIGASPGVATGTVRAIRRAADFHRVSTGDVLVCQHTDPAWTPLFGIATAVVTETGGLLSHAAIVARETGLPAVVAVTGATGSLPEGSTVTVDGDRGVVSRA